MHPALFLLSDIVHNVLLRYARAEGGAPRQAGSAGVERVLTRRGRHVIQAYL